MRKAISNSPKGKMWTYKKLAKTIGKPKAARAMANACWKNPDPRQMPWHRVIRSDGNSGGYSGKGGVNSKISWFSKSYTRYNRNLCIC